MRVDKVFTVVASVDRCPSMTSACSTPKSQLTTFQHSVWSEVMPHWTGLDAVLSAKWTQSLYGDLSFSWPRLKPLVLRIQDLLCTLEPAISLLSDLTFRKTKCWTGVPVAPATAGCRSRPHQLLPRAALVTLQHRRHLQETWRDRPVEQQQGQHRSRHGEQMPETTEKEIRRWCPLQGTRTRCSLKAWGLFLLLSHNKDRHSTFISLRRPALTSSRSLLRPNRGFRFEVIATSQCSHGPFSLLFAPCWRELFPSWTFFC